MTVFGVIGSHGVAYVWAPDGTRRDLTPPPGASIDQVSRIRGHRIIGSAAFTGGDRAVEWDLSGP